MNTLSMRQHAAAIGLDLRETVVWDKRIIGATPKGDLYLWSGRRWVRLQPVTPSLMRDLKRLRSIRESGGRLPLPRRVSAPSIAPDTDRQPLRQRERVQ